MFRLPDFLRTAWVSDRARDTWKPRFEAIRQAWPRVILNAAAESTLECRIRIIPPRMIFLLQSDARRQGLSAVVLGTRGQATPSYLTTDLKPTDGMDGRPFHYEVAIGTEAGCAAAEQLWHRQEYSAAYQLSGTPDCCASALQRDHTLQRSDTVWRYLSPARSFDAPAASMADPLWFWLNCGALSFAPCSVDCAKALGQRGDLVTMARRFGYEQEMDHWEEVLTWPAEWTALHGIAELKTPVLKATWATDVSHVKATFRYHGLGYPDEGATGLDFPFRSQSRPLLTSSVAFQRGLSNLIQIRS